MKCINVIRLGHKSYNTCNGNLIATLKIEYDKNEYEGPGYIVVDVKCDNCGSTRHTNLADVEEIYNLDKFITDYIAKA